MRRLIASLMALAFAAPAAAASKTYSADRFDARIRVLDAGAIEVVETVVFRFEGGPFKEVFRELPRRRTDDIEIVGARMDGRALETGKEQGQFEVRNGENNKVRVVWRFAPRADSTNTFELTYIARGVVYRDGGLDVLAWTALPTEHNYRIDRSEVVIELPAVPRARPTISSRRVSQITDASLEPGGHQVQVVASGIAKNGSFTPRITFDEGALIAAAPAWQARQLEARALAPQWITAAAIIFAAGIILVVGLYQRYDRPAGIDERGAAIPTPPDKLRAGVAGVVAANGRVGVSHAMATLFALADRGVVTIVEEPRRWGQRHFTLQRGGRSHAIAPEEAAVMALAFRNKGRDEDTAPLMKARNRLTSGMRTFKSAVYQELRALGLLDDDRMKTRGRFLHVSIVLLVITGLLVMAAGIATVRYQGWPFLIPAATGAVAILGFIFYGALTPLSNEGARSAERWRSYQKHLKDVARDRAQLVVDSPSRIVPFAVALGLTGLWSKYMKHHPSGIPPWFRALGVSDQEGFPSFLAAIGTGADGGGGGAGAASGAAGGGGSGAS